VASRTVVISRRGVDRLRAGHPWIYRSDVIKASAAPGDIVRVLSERHRPLGSAFYSSTSQISLRMLALDEDVSDDDVWLRDRIDAAIAYRASMQIADTAFRIVNAEADRLPGLIVDGYGDGDALYLVVQTLSQGMDRRLAQVIAVLVDVLKPRGMLARNDVRVRTLEGLEAQVEVLHGDVPDRVPVREGRILYDVDLRGGQKTGLFLDQRENHAAAAGYARGRALDAFTYAGGFALAIAPACERVLALDSSATAVAATRENAVRNRLSNLEVREANVFDELRELEIAGERFETVVLDPPAFAKNKASIERAAAGYKEINLRALKLLVPGGYLITCSCSYNVSEEMFLAIVDAAAADARATVSLVEKRMQARDHPVLLNVPETHYLKCFILRRLD
jgi:23S rRNA (cytosine1962-C5)-methyltransferase